MVLRSQSRNSKTRYALHFENINQEFVLNFAFLFKKFRSSHRRCYVQTAVLKNLPNFTGLFLIIFKSTYFEEHLRTPVFGQYCLMTGGCNRQFIEIRGFYFKNCYFLKASRAFFQNQVNDRTIFRVLKSCFVCFSVFSFL